jgi:hypothetical protein
MSTQEGRAERGNWNSCQRMRWFLRRRVNGKFFENKDGLDAFSWYLVG